MSRLIILMSIVATISFIGCEVPTKDKIYGTYKAEFPFGEETVVLNRDDTYEQTIIVYEKNDTVSQQGTWKYGERAGAVYLDHGLTISHMCDLNSDYDVPADGSRMFVVGYALLGRIYFGSTCEGMYNYVKQD